MSAVAPLEIQAVTDVNQTPEINKLAGALAKAQLEIQTATKGRENTFFGSKYATLTDVWEACREPLAKNGIAVLQVPQITVEGLQILETTVAHESGQWMRGRYRVNPVKNDPQGLGSAMTYARRYSLASMIGVVADEDDDGNAASGKGDERKESQADAMAKIAAGRKQEERIAALRAELLATTTPEAVKDWAKKYEKEPDAIRRAIGPTYTEQLAKVTAFPGPMPEAKTEVPPVVTGSKPAEPVAAPKPAEPPLTDATAARVAVLTPMLDASPDDATLKSVGAAIAKETKAVQDVMRPKYLARKSALSKGSTAGQEVAV